MFSKVISHKGFWRSVTFLSAMFIIIYNFVDLWMVFEFKFQAYTNERFAVDKLLRFAFANILSGFVYGFIVSYFKFKNKIKKQPSSNHNS